MEIAAEDLRKIAFLGFAERASSVREGHNGPLKWNVIGLKHCLITYFLPTDLQYYHIALAVNDAINLTQFKLRIRSDADPEKVVVLKYTLKAGPELPVIETTRGVSGMSPAGWTVLFVQVEVPQIIHDPGIYTVYVVHPAGEEAIGSFECLVAKPLRFAQRRTSTDSKLEPVFP